MLEVGERNWPPPAGSTVGGTVVVVMSGTVVVVAALVVVVTNAAGVTVVLVRADAIGVRLAADGADPHAAAPIATTAIAISTEAPPPDRRRVPATVGLIGSS